MFKKPKILEISLIKSEFKFEDEKIKNDLNRGNTQEKEGKGELEFKKFFFKNNKFKHKKYKYKEIRLDKANSDFIVVRHFLAYIHFSQISNRVRVPPYLKLRPCL